MKDTRNTEATRSNGSFFVSNRCMAPKGLSDFSKSATAGTAKNDLTAIRFLLKLDNSKQKHMQNLIKTDTQLDIPKEQRELELVIAQKEILLVDLLEQIEDLNINLSTLKHEYNLKIGRLYLQLDELNFELLRYKKIEIMLKTGKSLKEARLLVDDELMEQSERIRAEYERLDEEESKEVDQPVLSEEETGELKQLWHKLAHKYHPDVVGGDADRMKRINQAYGERNLEALRNLDSDYLIKVRDTTVEKLRSRLLGIQESIIRAKLSLSALKRSEWFKLAQNIENACKKNRDLLHELADKILSEIAIKETQLNKLMHNYE